MNNSENLLFSSDPYQPFRSFWQSQFEDWDAPYMLQFQTENSDESDNFIEAQFLLPEEVSNKIMQMVKGNDIGVFITILSGVKIVLSRYSNSTSTAVYTPLFKAISIPALFEKRVLLQSKIDSNNSLKELLGQVKKSLIECYKYQNFPYDQLNVTSEPEFTNVMISHANIHAGSPIQCKPSLHIEVVSNSPSTENESNPIKIKLRFKADEFPKDFDTHFNQHLSQVLSYLKSPETAIKNIEITSDEERKTLVEDFNKGYNDIEFKSLLNRFNHVAQTSSDSIAVSSSNRSLTFVELNKQANMLANRIIEQGTKPKSIVGVMLSRTENMLVTLLGIHKANCIYLPLDPGHPKDRIQYILEDSKAQLIITDGTTENLTPNFQGIKLNLSISEQTDSTSELISDQSIPEESDTAYIIYTSGSTGKPKGVLVSHGNLSSFLEASKQVTQFTSKDKMAWIASSAFDIAHFESLSALLEGGETKIYTKDEVLAEVALTKILNELTAIHAVPAFFQQMIHFSNRQNHTFPGIKKVFVGGDKVPLAMSEELKKVFPNAEVNILYGPTEATIFCTTHPNKDALKQPIIGTPTSNAQLYILNNDLKIQPIGIPGEICVGGMGVAKGYLNQPELTEKRFVAHPFETNSTLYRTGDLGRWNKNGEIEFIGRSDNQVKIRGFRIELGEIENQLLQVSQIKEALVLAKTNEQEEHYLCAYIVCNADLNSDLISSQLTQSLPEYMIPTFFVKMDQFPLTSNGKIDRNILPEPNKHGLHNYVAPVNPLESELTKLWAKVLNLDSDKISTNVSFFKIGGHSLKATQLANFVLETFNKELSIRKIFELPSIQDQAQFLEQQTTSSSTGIEAIPLKSHYDLSHAQKMLWVSNEMGASSNVFNIPFAFILNGDLNQSAFEKTLDFMFNRHEVLRTTFDLVDGIPKQFIQSSTAFKLAYLDLSQQDDALKEAEIIANKHANAFFDLRKDILFKAQLIQTEPSQFVFAMNMHHIISDGWSMQIFMEEAMHVYKSLHSDLEPELTELPIHYKDFAAWQNAQIAQTSNDGLQSFWTTKYSTIPLPIQLPTYQTRPEIKTYAGDRYFFQLSDAQGKQLNELLTNEWNTSEFVCFQTILSILLFRYSGTNDLIIGTPTSGRNRPELLNQIGYYTNLLALRNNVTGTQTFIELLQQINEATLDVFDHQEYPFDLLLNELKPERDDSRLPLINEGMSWNDMGDLSTSDGAAARQIDFSNQLTIQTFPTELKFAKYDLWLYGTKNEANYQFAFEYNTDLFTAEQVSEFSESFSKIIDQILSNPTITVSELELITAPAATTSENESFDFNF